MLLSSARVLPLFTMALGVSSLTVVPSNDAASLDRRSYPLPQRFPRGSPMDAIRHKFQKKFEKTDDFIREDCASFDDPEGDIPAGHENVRCPCHDDPEGFGDPIRLDDVAVLNAYNQAFKRFIDLCEAGKPLKGNAVSYVLLEPGIMIRAENRQAEDVHCSRADIVAVENEWNVCNPESDKNVFGAAALIKTEGHGYKKKRIINFQRINLKKRIEEEIAGAM